MLNLCPTCKCSFPARKRDIHVFCSDRCYAAFYRFRAMNRLWLLSISDINEYYATPAKDITDAQRVRVMEIVRSDKPDGAVCERFTHLRPKAPCGVDGCDRGEAVRNMCRKHYQMFREKMISRGLWEEFVRNARQEELNTRRLKYGVSRMR